MAEATLNIAEVLGEGGHVMLRYARKLSPDGRRWIRHGLFLQYYPDGRVASEGEYVEGKEDGLWRDYFPTGRLAAEGRYVNGKEQGAWCFFNEDGSLREKKTF